MSQKAQAGESGTDLKGLLVRTDGVKGDHAEAVGASAAVHRCFHWTAHITRVLIRAKDGAERVTTTILAPRTGRALAPGPAVLVF